MCRRVQQCQEGSCRRSANAEDLLVAKLETTQEQPGRAKATWMSGGDLGPILYEVAQELKGTQSHANNLLSLAVSQYPACHNPL